MVLLFRVRKYAQVGTRSVIRSQEGRASTACQTPRRRLPRAFAFLSEHMNHIEFQHGDPAFAPEEEESRYFTPGGELKDDFPYRTLFYKDVADVICDFVHKQHEAGRGVPIRTCKRPGCGKLVAQFKKREYCRTTLCDWERQKRDDDVKLKKNRDNVFLSRVYKLPAAMRRKKLRESADRLREIESYWRDRNQSLSKHALKLLKEAGQISEPK